MFSPYHNFDNCKKLTRCINDLFNTSCVSTSIFNRYHNYHGALEQKLKGAKFNLDQLERLITTNNLGTISENLENFMFQANLHIDGFFYNGGSALDILAREILAVFNIQPIGDVHYRHAHSNIQSQHPNDTILIKLNEPTWKNEFSNYRNASTHEVLLSTKVDLSIQKTSQGQTNTLKLPLPDNPRVEPSNRTFNKNPDAFKYCQQSF